MSTNIKIDLTLDIDMDNDTITVSGDSVGIYPLSEEVINGELITDAIRGNQDAVERATLKLIDIRLHKLIYDTEYTKS